MTPYQIELVQQSFRKVAAISETAAELFYSRLFQLDPRLRSLFRSDMREQGKKLMDMLRLVVSNLGTIDRVAPVIAGLARRHESYESRTSITARSVRRSSTRWRRVSALSSRQTCAMHGWRPTRCCRAQ